jgi:hypothetical protein
MQKMARDRLKEFKKGGYGALLLGLLGLGPDGQTAAESVTTARLAFALNAAGVEGMGRAWGEAWESVYGLAEMVSARRMAALEQSPAKFAVATVSRL